MCTRLPRLAAEHPAAVESAGYEALHFIECGLSRPKYALQRTGAKRFGLMSHWFCGMIGFGKASQIQEGNENVV
jgi:hypothetical protein